MPSAAPPTVLALGVHLAAIMPSAPDDLLDRIVTRRFELLHRLSGLATDDGEDAAATRHEIRSQLSLLDHMIKEGVRHGWGRLDAALATRLKQWLSR